MGQEWSLRNDQIGQEWSLRNDQIGQEWSLRNDRRGPLLEGVLDGWEVPLTLLPAARVRSPGKFNPCWHL